MVSYRDQAQDSGILETEHHSASLSFSLSLTQNKKPPTSPTYHLAIQWVRVVLCPAGPQARGTHLLSSSTSRAVIGSSEVKG